MNRDPFARLISKRAHKLSGGRADEAIELYGPFEKDVLSRICMTAFPREDVSVEIYKTAEPTRCFERGHKYPGLDIVYLTYAEPNRERNFADLLRTYQHAKRVHGVVGMNRAFRVAAAAASTDWFILIDGDNHLTGKVDLRSIGPPQVGAEITVFRAYNPITGGAFGYGGIKVFRKHQLLYTSDGEVDPAYGGGVRSIQADARVASVTEFNTSAKSTWKAAFREVAMLKANHYPWALSREDAARQVNMWKNPLADAAFATFARDGARAGEEFAMAKLAELGNINDPIWLDQRSNLQMRYDH